MKTPKKPFESFRWRWASVEPTEGLLRPPVFFGVLRAIQRCEGLSKSSGEVYEALKQVERDTDHPSMRSERLRLARDPDRNLFRNAGQYWQALGLLEANPGELILTDVGRRVANRSIPQDEFIAATVRNLTLPNERVLAPKELEEWRKSGLQIFPLRLLLTVLAELYEISPSSAYLTDDELCRIVIPLSGVDARIEQYVEALLAYREERLNVDDWPNCTPAANDKRSAREYLRFLSENGLLEMRSDPKRGPQRYCLLAGHIDAVSALLERAPDVEPLETAVDEARDDGLVSIVARARRMVQRTERIGQREFRRGLFKAYGQRCVVTGETLTDVLEAAHIVHVRWGGTDELSNGLPVRSDIHILWDERLIDFHADGSLIRDARLESSPTYSQLPSKVSLPPAVLANIKWRLEYQ